MKTNKTKKEKKDNTKEVNYKYEYLILSDEPVCWNCDEFWIVGNEYGKGMCTHPFSVNYKKEVSYDDTCNLFDPVCDEIIGDCD